MDLAWIVVYKDGTVLEQFPEEGGENTYGDIDRENISEFHIVDKEEARMVYALALDEGQRLIYRQRKATSGVTNEILWTIFMVGWQQTINGQNVQSIGWVFPDGSIIQTGKFRDDHRLFYGVELLDFEETSVSASE